MRPSEPNQRLKRTARFVPSEAAQVPRSRGARNRRGRSALRLRPLDALGGSAQDERTRANRYRSWARRRWKAAIVVASVITALPLGAARGEDGPRTVVERTTTAVINVLADTSLSSDQKRSKIEDVVYANVDFATLSRLVLARNWRRLTEAQRAEFTNEFKRHLSVTYGKNIEDYKNEHVAILGERKEARGDWTVRSKVVRGGPDDILVDYRLRHRNGRWGIIDVVVEGVSLVSNFRSQFQEIISRQGVEKLLQLLRQKNAGGEPLKS